ncbi:hypothetical protein [Thermococcus sp. JCM 11816]|uniref:hypothetical protein n=1 Tax=Thermococcus sp. (strain JCM 11816 / KS-1) TaxID=1295125 RepID=UPI0006D075D4
MRRIQKKKPLIQEAPPEEDEKLKVKKIPSTIKQPSSSGNVPRSMDTRKTSKNEEQIARTPISPKRKTSERKFSEIKLISPYSAMEGISLESDVNPVTAPHEISLLFQEENFPRDLSIDIRTSETGEEPSFRFTLSPPHRSLESLFIQKFPANTLIHPPRLDVESPPPIWSHIVFPCPSNLLNIKLGQLQRFLYPIQRFQRSLKSL